MKKGSKNLVGKPCWAHHPRGGIVTGVAGKIKKGLYSQERTIGPYSFPVSQIYFTPPPQQKDK
jgi:hypothetical protein